VACEYDVIKHMLLKPILSGRIGKWAYALVEYDFVIPRSERVGTKPPYMCPGCFIHTYSNNMINRFHVP
jgi:hypothetical protein